LSGGGQAYTTPLVLLIAFVWIACHASRGSFGGGHRHTVAMPRLQGREIGIRPAPPEPVPPGARTKTTTATQGSSARRYRPATTKAAWTVHFECRLCA